MSGSPGGQVEFRVLGPVEVWFRGQRLPPFPRKPTALLTAGLVDAGKLVSVDRLVDAVWGDQPPASAAKLVQGYVLKLRQVLHRTDTRELITTRPRGYVFEPEDGQLDLQLFQALLEQGHSEASRGEHGRAADLFDQALGLWRGPALGAPTTPALRAEAARLEEIRLATVERVLDARLALGGGAELVGDLTGLVAEHPLRERLRALLITTLDRCGRRAEALAVYRDGRHLLRTELGIEPGPELRAVHARLLAADEPADSAAVGEEHARPARWESRRRRERGGAQAPVQLPSAPRWLTGRDAETARLVSALRAGGEHSRVCVVHGMAGVGKTALALRVAHRVAVAFPDGQLHAGLGGGDPARSADPAEVLAAFLRALGVGPGQIPPTLPERAAAFRTVLSGLRVLVVLDDAGGEEQVRHLLPGAGSGSAVLISSRKALHGLDPAERVALDVLNPDDAVELLARLAGRERTAAEPEAAAEIAQLAGGLPLALRIAGSRLGTRGAWPLGALAERLRDEHVRLDEMACGDLDVRAGIEVSYRALPASERLVFRRLGLLESPDLAPWVAAPLAGIDVPDAERLVDRLADAHLLEPLGADGTGRVRYRFHDLVRLYARERADLEDTPRDRSAALSRLLRTWLALTRRAGDLDPTGVAHLVPRTAEDSDTALGARLLAAPRAWLQAEHRSLVAGVVLAARLDLHEEACDLASALVQASFRVNNQFDEWQRTHEAALAAVRRAGNPRGEAVMLTGLGQLRYEQDRFAEAKHYFRDALAGFERLGDIGGRATALAGIAAVGREQGDFAEATACLEQALPAFEELGDAAGAAGARYDLGCILREKGDFAEATAHLRKALTIHRSIGSRRGEGLTLRAIGLVHRAEGDLVRAEKLCSQALDLLRSAGDRLMEAYAVQALAKVRLRLRPDDAELPELLGALRVCRELDDGFGEALMLRTLGELHLARGRVDHASACLRQALDLWTRLGHPVFRARTLRDLSRLHEALGDRPAARALRREALLTFQLYGTREYAELRAVEEADPSAAPHR
ncbi:AfsR/SARP family transcriptional regulator [Streptomyces deccanensis]|uniref:AfsR/SARP family transcriptional regulator n=1 Tax=Streptomyces deccanensis TaxID=424188 RepID=UPI001EFBAB06|nr:BTAD domain-containing putative transcriptional regulator [Streptomyces deccanensis]ULR54004.1 tetratricopeptide repeat protein [Streptomyces deccanensis]